MVVIRQIEARQGLDTAAGSVPSTRIDGGIAEGLGRVASGLGDMAQASQAAELRLQQQRTQMVEFKADQEFRRLNTQLAGDYAERQVNIDPSGAGFADSVAEDFSTRYSEFVQNVPEQLRPRFEELAASEQESWIAKAAATEADQRNTWYRNGIAETLDGQQTEVFNNPGLYDTALDSVNRSIEASGLPPAEQMELKRKAQNALSISVAERLQRDDPQTLARGVGIETVAGDATASSNYIDVARSFIGANEEADAEAIASFIERSTGQTLDPRQTAWCAAFLNGILGQAGLGGTGSNAARSFLEYGEATDEPQVGDIVVLSRGDPNGWQGHVGIFAGRSGNGRIRILGGNQSDGVNISEFDASRVLGYRRPPSVPDAEAAEALMADFPGGGPQEGLVVGSSAYELDGLTFSQRLQYHDQAVARQAQILEQQQAQQKAQYDALKGSLELGIQTGEVASEQTILGSELTDSDKATMIRSFRAAQGAEQAASEFVRQWANGTQPELNPYSTDDRNLAGDAFDAVVNAVEEDQRPAVAAQFVRDTGVVPNQVVAGLRQQLTSLDINQVQAGLEQAAQIYDAAPQGLNAVEHGSSIRDAAMFYNETVNSRGLTNTQAAQRWLDQNDPTKQQSRDVLSRMWGEVEEDFTVNDVTAALDENGVWPGGQPSAGITPQMEGALLADYLDFAEDAFVRANGDVELAKSLAIDDMRRTYGVSNVSGAPTMMRLPPENFYPPIDGGHEYIRRFALREARTLDPNASDVFLESVPGQTNVDVQAGIAPAYALRYRTGKGEPWQMAPQPFTVSGDEMQALSRIVSQERELLFQQRRQDMGQARDTVPFGSEAVFGLGGPPAPEADTPEPPGPGAQAPTQNTQTILNDLNAQREQLFGGQQQAPINVPSTLMDQVQQQNQGARDAGAAIGGMVGR